MNNTKRGQAISEGKKWPVLSHMLIMSVCTSPCTCVHIWVWYKI